MTCHQVAELKHRASLSKSSVSIGILSLGVKNLVLREAAQKLKVVQEEVSKVEKKKRQDVARMTFENWIMFLFCCHIIPYFRFVFLCLSIAGLTLKI